jgi:hypothetical protein
MHTEDARRVCRRSTADHFQVIVQVIVQVIEESDRVAQPEEGSRRRLHPVRAPAEIHGRALQRGIPGRLNRHHEDPQRPQPGLTASGIRLQTAGILLARRRENRRARGRVAQREAGVARATNWRGIT